MHASLIRPPRQSLWPLFLLCFFFLFFFSAQSHHLLLSCTTKREQIARCNDAHAILNSARLVRESRGPSKLRASAIELVKNVGGGRRQAGSETYRGRDSRANSTGDPAEDPHGQQLTRRLSAPCSFDIPQQRKPCPGLVKSSRKLDHSPTCKWPSYQKTWPTEQVGKPRFASFSPQPQTHSQLRNLLVQG